MLTRSLLFLLAIVTGLSAAQASDDIRHRPQTVGATMLADQAVAVLSCARQKSTRAHLPLVSIDHFDRSALALLPLHGDVVSPRPLIFIGDRNRQ